MPAPSCLRWAGALPRPPEWIVYGARCRSHNFGFVLKRLLCVLVIVLMTVPSVLGDECATKTGVPSDGVSRALLAPQVIEAVLQDKIQSSASVYEAIFRVVRVYKRYRGPGRIKKHRNVSLPFRKPGTGTENNIGGGSPNDCLVTADLQKHRKYFLFLSSATNRHEPLINVAPPIPSSKRSKKRIKQVVCSGCAKAPSVGRLRNDSVVRGHSANLTCTFDGSPPPIVTWLKDGRIIDPTKKRNFRIHTRRIRIRPRNRRPRRKRRRKREDRRTKDVEGSTIQRRRKSRRKKGMRGRSQSVQVISTLSLVSSRKIDVGVYSCVGKSVLGEASAKAALNVVPPIDPGIVYPCPYDSFCLNGGTCMFFKHFGEFVCQCAEGYKGQRCQEKEVFPTISDPSCRGSKSYHSPSRGGMRCPRNQPLWEFVQQSLAARKHKVTPWTKHHQLNWTPTHIGLPWDEYLGRVPTLTQSPNDRFSHTNNEPFKFLQNFTFTIPTEGSGRRKGQLYPQRFNFGFLDDAPSEPSNSSETTYGSSEYVDPLTSVGPMQDDLIKDKNTPQNISSPKENPLWNVSSVGQYVNDEKIRNFTSWFRNVGYDRHLLQTITNYEPPKKVENVSSNKVRHRHQKQKHLEMRRNKTDQWTSKTSLPSIRPTPRRSYILPTSLSPEHPPASIYQNYSSENRENGIKR